MKKVLIYMMISVAVFAFVSCTKSNKVLVKETGEKFIEAVLTGDLETAKGLVTPATSEKWGSTAAFLDDTLTPEWKAALRTAQTRISDVTVTGDEAHATVAIAIPSLGGEITILHFKKLNSKWLINEPGILVREVIQEDTQIIDTL